MPPSHGDVVVDHVSPPSEDVITHRVDPLFLPTATHLLTDGEYATPCPVPPPENGFVGDVHSAATTHPHAGAHNTSMSQLVITISFSPTRNEKYSDDNSSTPAFRFELSPSKKIVFLNVLISA